MIGLDTNVLVRFLVRDDEQQAEEARALLESLTADDRPGFVCREVIIELVRVLERAYGFSPGKVAKILVELVATGGTRYGRGQRRGSRCVAIPRVRRRILRSDNPCGVRTIRSVSALQLRQKDCAD